MTVDELRKELEGIPGDTKVLRTLCYHPPEELDGIKAYAARKVKEVMIDECTNIT